MYMYMCIISPIPTPIYINNNVHILDAIDIMVGKRFGLESHSDQVAYHFNIFTAVTVTVQCKRHEQLLSWPSQLRHKAVKLVQIWALVVQKPINIH